MMQDFFNNMNLQKTILFFQNSYTTIIIFMQDLYNKLTGIKNVHIHGIGSLMESMPIIFQFLLGLIYLLIIGTALLYTSVVFGCLKKIILIVYKIILYTLIKPLLFLITCFKKEKQPNRDLEKELLILRLQNGKLQKQIERDKKHESKKPKK